MIDTITRERAESLFNSEQKRDAEVVDALRQENARVKP